MGTTNIEVANNLIIEANKALEEHEYYKASLLSQEASRYNYKNPIPHLIQILANYKVTEINDLQNYNFDFDEDKYRVLRSLADENLNKELDEALSDLEGFDDYRNFIPSGDLGNVVKDDFDCFNSNSDDYEKYEKGNVEKEDFNSSNRYTGNYERYESGNVEDDDSSQDLSAKKITNKVKEIEFSGAISKVDENVRRKDEDFSKNIIRINEESGNSDSNDSKQGFSEEDDEDVCEAHRTEVYESEAVRSDSQESDAYVSSEETKHYSLKTVLDFLLDIYPKKIRLKINTALGKQFLSEGESFASTATLIIIFTLFPLIIGLPAFFFQSDMSIFIIIVVLLTIYRFLKLYKYNIILYEKNLYDKNISATRYFIKIFTSLFRSAFFYCLVIFSYWGAIGFLLNGIPTIFTEYPLGGVFISKTINSMLPLFGFILGIIGQKFIYLYYKSVFRFLMNINFWSRRLFNS